MNNTTLCIMPCHKKRQFRQSKSNSQVLLTKCNCLTDHQQLLQTLLNQDSWQFAGVDHTGVVCENSNREEIAIVTKSVKEGVLLFANLEHYHNTEKATVMIS
ncbi:hypothetical protein CHARACLAT_017224 [Characodon lateralis]|uniref:Uncharacterized protein n=1 Tax=Characodon lateralis TaxID=208331 RepID=A0ABU7E3A9_9TELE|nr:hypothetical protein [Characodon lateralis]